MDEPKEKPVDNGESANIPESPKPLAFTIDFGNGKSFDTQRHKTMMDKFQKKHRRGQSLSKLDDTPTKTHPPLTGTLSRKSSFQSDTPISDSNKRPDMVLPLKNVTWDRMTQSVPNAAGLSSINSPEIELKDVSSPELDLISPISPTINNKQLSSPELETNNDENVFIDGAEYDFDKSDTVSDAGTYTLDADNYTEEQKARMSIDREFKIEQVSLQKKTEEYVRSLAQTKENQNKFNSKDVSKGVQMISLSDSEGSSSLKSPTVRNKFVQTPQKQTTNKVLSPILSPTQNVSITESVKNDTLNNENDNFNQTVTKILYPSEQAKRDGLDEMADQGTIISVTSSGAFRSKNDQKKSHQRKYSLSKSEIQVQAYIDDKIVQEEIVPRKSTPNLSSNIVNVQNIPMKNGDQNGKTSPSKIPSPIHTLCRPRSRNGLNIDLSDASLDTEIILKPTQNYINSLQQRLSLDNSDPDSDYDTKFGIKLNNTAHLLKQKASHTRHNSLDDRTMNNKLEHFQNKNLLQSIDQTYSNLLNQYGSPNKFMHKIQNSPNNSPIKRSSSFSTKNQINTKNTNIITQKESNLCNSPSAIQRSSSTACIKPNFIPANRRSSITTAHQDHQKIDRNQFGDTESSSEDDFDKMVQKRANITNTRCNRAFSLRRARLDEPLQQPLKCPNTPEMRRKLQTDGKMERAISVDRKPVRTNEVQSRYLQNISKRTTTNTGLKGDLLVKNVPKTVTACNSVTKTNLTKTPTFSRTDSGRFSMRVGNSKPPVSNSAKGLKKDAGGKGEFFKINSILCSLSLK